MKTNTKTVNYLYWLIIILISLGFGGFIVMNGNSVPKPNNFEISVRANRVPTQILEPEKIKMVLESKLEPHDVGQFVVSDFYNQAINLNRDVIAKDSNVIAGVVPHHQIAGSLVADFFSRIKGQKNVPATIIVIGPDHFHKCQQKICSTNINFENSGIITEIDEEMLTKLSQSNILAIDNDLFNKEHAIGSLVPYIQLYLPKAKIVPIVIDSSIGGWQLQNFQSYLQKNLDNNTLVVGSIDFSHGQNEKVANNYDIQSLDAIKRFYNGESGAFRDYSDEHFDSIPTMKTVLSYAKSKESSFELLRHSNYNEITGEKSENITSYYEFSFTNNKKIWSMSAVGDIMLDRFVGQQILRNGYDYPVKEASSYLKGNDLVLGNLESILYGDSIHNGAIPQFAAPKANIKTLKMAGFNILQTVNNHSFDFGKIAYSQSNKDLSVSGFDYIGFNNQPVEKVVNGQRIMFFAVNLVGKKTDPELLKLLEKNKSPEILKIVLLHWGNEYQTKQSNQQIEFAHSIVDKGADLVIGGHPHVLQGVERYGDALIFYSLGNFIFDQRFSRQTQESILLNFNFVGNKIKIVELVPLVIKQERPIIAEGSEAEQILQTMANSSHQKDLKDGLRDGKIIPSW